MIRVLILILFGLAIPISAFGQYIRLSDNTVFKTGDIFIAENIFFETDKAQIMDSSKTGLENLKQILLKNPSMHVELQVRQDGGYSEGNNSELSKERGEKLRSKLISIGVKGSRIKTKPFMISYCPSRLDVENESFIGYVIAIVVLKI